MSYRIILSLGLVFGLPVIGCGNDGGGDETEAPADDDTAHAEEIFSDFGDNAFEGWSTIPEEGAQINLSGDHSGAYVISYANDIAAEALAGWTGTMPDGGMLVKVQYSDAEATELSGYTVMEKIDGYASNSGDWFWAGYNAAGDVSTAGAPSYCINCHASAATTADYIRTEF